MKDPLRRVYQLYAWPTHGILRHRAFDTFSRRRRPFHESRFEPTPLVSRTFVDVKGMAEVDKTQGIGSDSYDYAV